MNSMITWVFTLLVVTFFTNASAKPIQSETPETSAARRMDSLAGYSFGTNKATRSVNDLSRSLLDSLGTNDHEHPRNANYLRSLDSIGGNNYLRSLDSLSEANFLKDLDSVSVAKLNRALETLGGGGGNYLHHKPSETIDFRTLDTLGGSNLLRGISKATGGHSDGKRLDTLSGLTLGHQKRTFDEVDRTAFDGFNKRNFDEIDRVGFDGFTKRNVRSVSTS